MYAIGDIHGRLDLFEALLSRIEADEATRPAARTTIVLLGDLIDRGPHSAQVIARARQLARDRTVEILSGNHEEMFLTCLTDAQAMPSFLKFGGLETFQSYGLDMDALLERPVEELQAHIAARLPVEDLDFVRSFKKLVRIGDYVFVHAGLRPGVPLAMQLLSDCRWIREPFLSHSGAFEGFVVHGHTITQEPDLRSNRLGIDTGAYLHGCLTAIGIEGTNRWFLSAREEANDSGTQEASPTTAQANTAGTPAQVA
ncbi:metallophosphoesterase family protein [Novosphingobium organovorum]|uniref:metallophosphoesterase family protein n=1 Tax=Novosphingobium organovorum TaxID=2930092 RepID=UPI002E13FE68